MRCLQRAALMTVESRRKTLPLDHRGLRSIPAFSLLLSLTILKTLMAREAQGQFPGGAQTGCQRAGTSLHRSPGHQLTVA